jgi:hypothetical protein
MSNDTNNQSEPSLSARWDTLARRRPDVVFMAPYMAYLGFMAIGGQISDTWPSLLPLGIALRGAAGLAVFWGVRKHLPSLGKPYFGAAVLVGIAATVLWVGGQHLLNQIQIGGWDLGGRLFLFPGKADVTDPREGISQAAWWTQAVMRITVACTAVPIVEEIFWRGFLLRALIEYDRFEEVPLGKFTWASFVGTALLSTLQHPDNWGVSIFCWFLYNALMYWKKSLLCVIIAHSVTNLVLYIYVIQAGDWQFW